jgi:tripartite-type tricarboxylate transporter receptor subunit TctC
MQVITKRRAFVGAGLALLADQVAQLNTVGFSGSLVKTALAQPKFPIRPITLIVPWPAAGATDLTMRILAEHAGRHLGQPIIIQNKAGAAGTLGMSALVAAAPDGYTLSQLPQTIYRAPYVQKVNWDPIRDVTPIIQISGNTFGILVPADSAFKTLDDVFAFAAKFPDRLTVATNGVGSTPHILMDELFARKLLRYIHVPYKGTSEQMVALGGGQIMVGVNSTGFAPFVETGRLRLITLLSSQRSKRWPDVPTLREQGFEMTASSPYGIGGPKGMPVDVVHALHDAFKIAMQHPAHIAELARYDQEIIYLNSDDYGRATREVYAAEKLLTERLGIARPQ